MESAFGSEFREICNHCVVMAAWSCKTLELFDIILEFFEKLPLTVKFLKIMFRMFSPRHRSALLCSNFMKLGRREVGKVVRYLRNKKNKNSPASQTVATAWIAPKICQRQPPTIYSECFRFHPNRLTFGGFIAERLNTAKSPSYANAIFGRRVASSRVTSVQINLAKGRISDLSPSRNRLDSSDLDPPYNTLFLGPTWVSPQHGILIGSHVLHSSPIQSYIVYQQLIWFEYEQPIHCVWKSNTWLLIITSANADRLSKFHHLLHS